MQDVCTHRWDLFSKIPWIVKRSGAYIGVVGILGGKKRSMAYNDFLSTVQF